MERQPENDMRGKVVILTGASRGIGKQAALMLAKRGARLVLAARTVEPDAALPGTLGETVVEVEALGGEAIAVRTDLTRPADLEALVAAATERFGGIDVLVNNAAATVTPGWNKGFMGLSQDEWREQVEINLNAPFRLMQLVVPAMASRGGGRIVNVTAGNAEVFRKIEEPPAITAQNGVNLTVPGYFAPKRALDKLGSVVAPELAQHGVAVVGLYPGWVATEIVSARLEQSGTAIEGHAPVPMEIPARMICYFAACADPMDYSGRLFWAERELKAMDLPLD